MRDHVGILHGSGRRWPASYGGCGRPWLRQPPWALPQGKLAFRLGTDASGADLYSVAHLRVGEGQPEEVGR